jgi:hypothetical protein
MGIHIMIFIFLQKNSWHLPLIFACTLHTGIEGVSDNIQLPRLAPNACHSYQYAVNQAVVIL